jgi:hypothetical protein
MKKPAATPEAPRGAASEPDVASPGAAEAERMRVVVRLNIEAVEALEDLSKQLRRDEERPCRSSA